MTTKPKLPEPPEFPVSNASYNSIVGKMHKAALAATTAEAAIAAVSLCRDALKGTNTYAKASRRYADQLLEALGGVTPAPTAEKVAEVVCEAAKIKPAMPQLQRPTALEAAAQGKVYSNKSNAKRGLRSLALDHLPVTFIKVGDGDEVQPVVTVTDDKGLAYAAERGIAAKVAA
jgi:hypothetical protein